MSSEDKKDLLDQVTGLPNMTDAEKDEGASKSLKAVIVGPIIFKGIGFGIAYSIFKFGSTLKYDGKIDNVRENELGYAYAGMYILGWMVTQLNMYPMIWKSRVMRSKSGNLRANMFIYKNVGKNASDGKVVYEDERDPW